MQFRRPSPARTGRTTSKTTTGVLSFTTERADRHGTTLTVHDFWAADEETAEAMMAFLARIDSRAATINFRRSAFPPYPALLHKLHRFRPTVEAWHPWMLRILDIPEAVRLRGWPHDLTLSMPMEIESENGDSWDRYLVEVCNGKARICATHSEGEVQLTRRQLAVWYASGYRTAASARLAGVTARSREALTRLVRGTADLEPWLPEHF
nr:sterol carrier protein domain-containing protein [Streptomyces sp. A1547]